MSNERVKVCCIYGTVTGKAQSIAEQIVETGASKGIKIELFSFESFGKLWDLTDLEVAVIVSSTTGDGEQPEALTKFWRKLRPKTLDKDFLGSLSYTILGLGDSNYNQFCNGPKNLHRRLSELGGKLVYGPGWADDGVGLELVVEPWLEGLWPVLARLQTPAASAAQIMEAPPSALESPPPPPPPPVCLSGMGTDGHGETWGSASLRYSPRLATVALDLPACPTHFLTIRWLEKEELTSPPLYQNGAKLPLADGPVVVAEVVDNRTLSRPGAVKAVKQIDLRLSEGCCGLDLWPGDTVGVICSNRQAEVEQLAQLLGLSYRLEAVLAIGILPDTKKARAKVPDHLPPEIRLQDLLATCLDIRAVPKKLMLRALVEHAADVREKRRLEELASKQGADEYMEFVRAAQLCLMDLLNAFPSCRPPIALLLEHLPRLLPRPYSIASPHSLTPTLSLVYTVVDRPRPGLASAWLAALEPHLDTVRLFPRAGHQFRPPALSDSLVMVCAGSGIGPFYGFLRHLQEQRMLYRGPLGESWLIFGCRSRRHDYLFQDELGLFKDNGLLARLTVCFSRDDRQDGTADSIGSGGDALPTPAEEVDMAAGDSDRGKKAEGGRYVQDGMTEEGEELASWILKKGARFYVCGDAANMGRAVQTALVEVLARYGAASLQTETAAEYVARMVTEKRYLQDLWL